VSEFLQVFEQKIYKFTTDYIRRLFNNINSNLNRRFNKEFKRDSQGRNRDWPTLEEKQIRELFEQKKKPIDELIQDFKYIRIPRTLVADSMRGDGFSLTRSDSVRYDRLLSEEEINRVKDKFNEDAEYQLEEAIRKHHNIASTNIPLFMWIILAWFASDNVLAYMSSPFFFYPISLILCVVATLFAMGLGGVIMPLVRHTVNQLLSRTGLAYRI